MVRVTSAGEVAVDLLARYDKLERQLAQAERVVDRRLGNMEGRGAAFASRLTAVFAGVSTVALARTFLSAAEASKQMDAQLRLATQTFGTFSQAQADVQRIAEATRSGLAETTTLYGNMLRATQALGGSQSEAARATETFSKALKIGGADANAAASATLQFGQALASGALRGDEFNSIAEASPRILRLVADALGVQQGQLRKLAEEGKLTSDVLQRAFTDRKFTAGIDAEFNQLPVTVGQAMTKVQNAAIVTFGAFDRGGQFSTALATFVSDGAKGFDQLSNDAEQTGVEIRATFDGLADAFQPLVDGARSAFAEIGGDARSVTAQIRGDISTLLGLFDRVRNLDTGAERAIRGGANALVRGGVLSNFYYTPEANMPAYSNARGRFDSGESGSRRVGEARARLRQQIERLERLGYLVPLRADGSVDEANIRRADPPPRPAPAPTPTQASSRRTRGSSAETLAKRERADEARALRSEQQFENEKAGLNSDLLRAKQAITSAAETVAAYELQEIEAQRTRQNANYLRDAELETTDKAKAKARAAELIAINDQVAAERARGVRLREEERLRSERVAIAQGDLQNARDIATAEGSLAETAQARRDSALKLLDLDYELERARLDAIVAAQQSTEAEKEIARRRLATLPTLKEADRKDALRATESPLERYQRRLNPDADEKRERVEGLVVAELDQVRNGINDAISSRLGVKDPLLKGVLDMFIEQTILRPIADAFAKRSAGGSGGGVLGSLAGAALSIFGGGPSFAAKRAASFSLPGFATGGTMRLGGVGGVDRNTLSLNGEPIARVSRGETLTVSPSAVLNFNPGAMAAVARPAGPTIVHQTFVLDARGGVTTTQLIDQMNGLAVQAAKEGAQYGRQMAVKDIMDASKMRL